MSRIANRDNLVFLEGIHYLNQIANSGEFDHLQNKIDAARQQLLMDFVVRAPIGTKRRAVLALKSLVQKLV